MADPATTGQARASLRGRIDRISFALTFGLVGGAALLLLVSPTVIVLITSLTSGFSLKFPPDGLSLKWYVALFTASPEIVAAAKVSLQVAALATAAAALLATAAALALARSQAALARTLDSLLMSPLLLPSLVLGLAMLIAFDRAGFELSLTTLVIGHIAICFPFILRTAMASLATLDPALLESATSLGARGWFAFRTVTLPLIRNGVGAGAFMAFMASYDNVAISLFLSDARTEVLPIRMWNLIENMLDVRAAAASGILIGATLLLLFVMERAFGLTRYLR
jgi:putative spermidine/putrescine transport system permease protein